MKKLVIICKENILSGYIKTGLSEIPDSLANTLSKIYDVSLICIDNHASLSRNVGIVRKYNKNTSHFKFSKVHYYLIDEPYWQQECVNLLNTIQPSIIHNFAEPNLISYLTYKPERTVYSFVNVSDFQDQENIIARYDKITTVSQTGKYSLLRQRSSISNFLMEHNLQGMSTGVLTQIFTPVKGFLLPNSYSSANIQGKQLCKKKMLKMYGIMGDPCIFFSGGLIQEPNLHSIIEIIPQIKENNGLLMIASKGDIFYEEELKKLSPKTDGVLYFDKYPSLVQLPLLISAADFYIQPKSPNMGNFMPLVASNYGTIPIVSLNNGPIIDAFSEENAIIAEDGLQAAVQEAFQLYNNSEEFNNKRLTCMNSVVTWDDLQSEYVALYEE